MLEAVSSSMMVYGCNTHIGGLCASKGKQSAQLNHEGPEILKPAESDPAVTDTADAFDDHGRVDALVQTALGLSA
eukprot:3868646-Prymnesium_polylepis.2